MEKWDYPEELLWLEEQPHVLRRRTPEEQVHATIGEELRRQHEALMEILDRLEQDGPDCGA